MRTPISLLIIGALLGCGGDSVPEPPRIVPGTSICTTCGMSVQDPHYAAATRTASGEERTFDSIECLIVNRRSHPDRETTTWLSDFPTGALHPAPELTVVRADYPSPMGKGYAAFLDPVRAGAEAVRRDGQAGPLETFLNPGGTTP